MPLAQRQVIVEVYNVDDGILKSWIKRVIRKIKLLIKRIW